MLTASPFMAFIPVRDLATARSFYAEILGLEVEDENPFAVILNSGGTMLRLTQVENHQPQPFTIAGWEVPDIGTTVEGLVSRGVSFIRFDGRIRMSGVSGPRLVVITSPGSRTPTATHSPSPHSRGRGSPVRRHRAPSATTGLPLATSAGPASFSDGVVAAGQRQPPGTSATVPTAPYAQVMPFDEGLAQRVRDLTQSEPSMSERKMFGGLCFMSSGYMCFGVLGDEIMVRVGPESYEGALQLDSAREMDFTGRSMRGMVYVGSDGISEDEELEVWLRRGLSYARSLPPKLP